MKKRLEIEEKILSWKIWIHVVIGLCTYFVWFIVLLIIFLDMKNIEKKLYNSPNGVSSSNSKYTPVKIFSFNVAGITHENRQELIEKMVKKAFKEGYYEKYDGMTNKDIKESYDTVFEANHIVFHKMKLNKTKFDDKDAVEVYVEDLCDDDKSHMVGYVPKNKIKELNEFLEYKDNHPEYEYKEFVDLVGGKGKRLSYDNEQIEEINLNYGIEVSLQLFNK